MQPSSETPNMPFCALSGTIDTRGRFWKAASRADPVQWGPEDAQQPPGPPRDPWKAGAPNSLFPDFPSLLEFSRASFPSTLSLPFLSMSSRGLHIHFLLSVATSLSTRGPSTLKSSIKFLFHFFLPSPSPSIFGRQY